MLILDFRIEALLAYSATSATLTPDLAFFTAQTVKIDDHNDEAARDNPLPEWIHIQQVCAVVNRRQDEGSEKRAVEGPDCTKQACPANDRGSDGLQFPTFRGSSVSDPDS